MPDLNLRNAAVIGARSRTSPRYWLDQGVDGFRLDGAQHLVEEDGVYAEHRGQQGRGSTGFNEFVKSVRADALLVGEIWTSSTVSSSYVPDQVDLAFDFDTADAASALASSGFADALLSAAESNLSKYPDWQVGVFSDNHDRDRLASLAADDPGRLRLIATWLLTAPGVPFVYYGQEIGLPGQKPDEQIRTPLPWTGDGPSAGFSTATAWEPLQPGWQQRNIAAQQADAGSLWNQYAQLVSRPQCHPRPADRRLHDARRGRPRIRLHALAGRPAGPGGGTTPAGSPSTGLTVTLPDGTPPGGVDLPVRPGGRPACRVHLPTPRDAGALADRGDRARVNDAAGPPARRR